MPFERGRGWFGWGRGFGRGRGFGMGRGPGFGRGQGLAMMRGFYPRGPRWGWGFGTGYYSVAPRTPYYEPRWR